jgi:hypothetical protein
VGKYRVFIDFWLNLSKSILGIAVSIKNL